MTVIFAVILIALPLGLAGIESLLDQVLLQRARHYLTQTLPIAQLCLDAEKLADGKLSIDADLTASAVASQFRSHLPAMLADRLQLSSVAVVWEDKIGEPIQWLGANQPSRLPSVMIEAVFIDHLGNEVLIKDNVEILLD